MIDNKQNGMMTKVWGPPGWFFLHSITFGYPDEITEDNVEKVQHYANFFNSLGNVLPCKYCRNSYNEYIQEIPIENFLSSRDLLVEWLYLIHNKVNNKLGVSKDCIPTLDEVKLKYEQYRAKCKQTTEKERNDNLVKGCTIPENGVKKRCLISVVNDNKTNKEFFEEKSNLFYIILFICIAIILTIIIVTFKTKFK